MSETDEVMLAPRLVGTTMAPNRTVWLAPMHSVTQTVVRSNVLVQTPRMDRKADDQDANPTLDERWSTEFGEK